MSDGLEQAGIEFNAVIEKMNRACAMEAGLQPGVVVDYLTIYSVRRYDDEGDPVTSYGMVWPPDYRTAHYAALGLVEYAREKIKRDLFYRCEDDE